MMVRETLILCIVLVSSKIIWLSKASNWMVYGLYVFGDSLVDNGNNNWLPTLAKANYPPYGIDFVDGPTGRFSNGKNVADFIADYLEVPYPPPYLKILRATSLKGYNYASGSCGILPETGSNLGVCLSLDKQIKLFETTIRTELDFKLSATQLSQHLSKSIFLFSVGNNDYINDYFRTGSSSRQQYSPQQFARLLIDALSQKLQKLYKLGARKVVVFELGPIGCIPSIVRNEKPSGKCVESKNKMISLFNDKLGLMLKNLTSTLKNSNFILGHANWLAYDALLHPKTYADYLGVPYPPPYLKVLRPKSLKGYNYASGACGILPTTGSNLGLCLTLDEQIRLFERTIRTELAIKLSPTQLTQHFSKSIFIFTVGNNDYLNDYFRTNSFSRPQYTPEQFAQLLIDALSQKLQKLYNLGARKVVIFEIGPIGCIPSIVRNEKPKNEKCVEDKNKMVLFFNDKLGLMLKNLTSTLKDSHFILGHAYWLGYDAILHPQTYGLSDSTNPCCIAWGNGTLSCIPALQSCKNPNKHYFWDGYHLTQATASIIASLCFNSSSVCLPINLQQLAQI